MNLLVQISGVLLLFITSCSVPPSDYAAYFKNEKNGLRKVVRTNGNEVLVQYMSPELKALNELGFEKTKEWSNRSEELKKYVLFELEIEGRDAAIKNYMQSALEYDIFLKAGNEIQRPVFYHLEKNPLTTSGKIQVYFLNKHKEKDYQLAIAENAWLGEVQFNILHEDIQKTPHINL